VADLVPVFLYATLSSLWEGLSLFVRLLLFITPQSRLNAPSRSHSNFFPRPSCALVAILLRESMAYWFVLSLLEAVRCLLFGWVLDVQKLQRKLSSSARAPVRLDSASFVCLAGQRHVASGDLKSSVALQLQMDFVDQSAGSCPVKGTEQVQKRAGPTRLKLTTV
jgi:hypothetical protein